MKRSRRSSSGKSSPGKPASGKGGVAALFTQALQRHQARRFPEAEEAFLQLLQRQPGHPDALFLLGVGAYESGRTEQALDWVGQAIAANPGQVVYLNKMGLMLKGAGRFAEAAEIFRRALQVKPDFAKAHNNLGAVLQELGRFDEAEAHFQKALAREPDNAKAHYNLACLRFAQGRLPQARAGFQSALDRQPDHVEARNNLGLVLLDQGLPGEAARMFEALHARRPDHFGALNHLGLALQEQGLLKAAEERFRQALALRPEAPEALQNLGNLLQDRGCLEESLACYRQAEALAPDDAALHSNALFLISYYGLRDMNETVEAHRAWDRRHGAAGREAAFTHPPGPIQARDRRLRIGYVGADFRRHPVAAFLEPMFLAHDRERFKIHCYAEVASPDAVTGRFRAGADLWRSSVGIADADLARLIHDDGVDVLIDLGGHTQRNRLPVFTYKPAPVQATYLGYCAGTGLAAMDYWITDPVLTPPDGGEPSVEKKWRLPVCWVGYRPAEGDVAPRMSPDKDPAFVFGSFNNLSKLTGEVLDLWGRILRELPGSKLLLQAKQLNDSAGRARMRTAFAEREIDPARLILAPHASPYLAGYGRMDVALDPFPRTGGVTTADALWMGVPVATLAGERMIARQGASLLTALGEPGWIAEDAESYVAIAKGLAEAGPRDDRARRALREQMAASPLCDGARLARDFEAACEQMAARR